jgi:hypothetical protein
MSNPKFSVGDLVAVCSFPKFRTVMPQTKVLGIQLIEKGRQITDTSGKRWRANSTFFAYLVDGCDRWQDEDYLRPILPGEYLESTHDQAIGVDA